MASRSTGNKVLKEKRDYPPSYYEYRKRNPTVSIKLTKDIKEALDKVRGEMSYSKFLKSLFVPGGAFIQFEKQRDRLAAERVAFENERKKMELEYDKKSQAIKEEKDALILDYEKKIRTLKNLLEDSIDTEHFFIPCSRCHKSILFISKQDNWNTEIKPRLVNMFHGYVHIECPR
jgi:hypothetical protein